VAWKGLHETWMKPGRMRSSFFWNISICHWVYFRAFRDCVMALFWRVRYPDDNRPLQKRPLCHGENHRKWRFHLYIFETLKTRRFEKFAGWIHTTEMVARGNKHTGCYGKLASDEAWWIKSLQHIYR